MRTVKLIVCILFFAVCAFFSLGTLITGSSVITEGGIEKPRLITETGVNRNFGNEYEEYFSRAFAYRRYVVDAWSALRVNLLHEGNDQVVVGKNGYLFFADTIDAYTGLNPMTDEEIAEAADSLLALQTCANEHGAKFCFLPAPDKNTIFPENMPSRYMRAKTTDLDRLLAALDERGVTYSDPREALTAAKSENIYYKTDTHWTPDGAELAFALTADKLGVQMFDTNTVGRVGEAIQGDLNTLLYPGQTLTESVMTADFSDSFIYTSAFSTPMDMVITSRGGGHGKALVFRDSFCNALLGLVSSTFSETQFERANPFRLDLLGTSKADYVIVEIAERNLRNLIGSDERIKEVID